MGQRSVEFSVTLLKVLQFFLYVTELESKVDGKIGKCGTGVVSIPGRCAAKNGLVLTARVLVRMHTIP